MARDDFSKIERRWQKRRLFGPQKRRPRVSLWLLMASLLASGMYIAAQTILPTTNGKPVQPAVADTQAQPKDQHHRNP